MKILNWHIYPASRIKKVVQLINGGSDDEKIAASLLVDVRPQKEIPKDEVERRMQIYRDSYEFKIVIEETTITLYHRDEGKWKQLNYSHTRIQKERDDIVKEFKRQIAAHKNSYAQQQMKNFEESKKPKFKKIVLKF